MTTPLRRPSSFAEDLENLRGLIDLFRGSPVENEPIPSTLVTEKLQCRFCSQPVLDDQRDFHQICLDKDKEDTLNLIFLESFTQR